MFPDPLTFEKRPFKVWISNYWDLLEETTESETAVLDVNEPRYTHFKNTKPWWNANGMPLTRIPKLTLLLHSTKGGMIWVAYSLEEVFLASLFKAAVVLHFRLTCSSCLNASMKTLSMACYRMPVGLTRDGNGRGIWNSRKNPFSKVHTSSCLSIRRWQERCLCLLLQCDHGSKRMSVRTQPIP